jgi:multiple sugar transport system permease protein
MNKKSQLTGLLLMLPAFLWVFLTIIYPFLWTIWLSFHDAMMTGETISGSFIGIENYINLIFNDSVFGQAIINTVLWTMGNFALSGLLGLSFALVLNEKFRGNTLVRVVAILPWIVPSVATAIVWRWLLHSQIGVVQGVLLSLNIIKEPIAFFSYNYALPSLIFVNAWRFTPFVVIFYLAGLESVPIELYEAAKIDGASAFQRFRYITMPSLKRILAVLGIIGVLWTFCYFDIIYLITKGGPSNATMTLPVLIWMRSFYMFRIGEGATISVFMILILLAFSIVYFKFIIKEGL